MSVSFWSFVDSCLIGNHTTSSFLYYIIKEIIIALTAGNISGDYFLLTWLEHNAYLNLSIYTHIYT